MNQFNNAIELLDYVGQQIEIKAPVDVESIAAMLNIRIEPDYSLELKNIVGEILFENERAIIRINPYQNSYSPRKRFTIAHEIGHFCLHRTMSKDGFIDSMSSMSRTESYWDSKESEANNFAAQLLMPKDLIIRDGQQVIDSYKAAFNTASITIYAFIERMADKFDVSSKAMEYRLKNLGIIS
jgi:Zn-dependent peptidase ImmA (M78 family)